MNLLVRFAFLCFIPFGLAATLHAQPYPNVCTDDYWSNTLRCKTFPLQVPQLNWGSVPTAASQVKTHTRVFLTDETDVRCLDGTFPVIYVDKAVTTNPSNKWVITLTGGGGAHPYDSDGDGVRDVVKIAETYLNVTERDEMGTSREPPMKSFGGIHLRDASNPTFSDYNRVRIEKCGYDRHMGRVAYTSAPGTGYFTVTPPGGSAVSFDLWQQGWQILEETLDALRPGLTYTTWTLDAAGAIVTDPAATLPPLDDAEMVLFVGHSGAAHGLMHNTDRLAAMLPQADVRALFDANFLPSMENEVGFDSTQAGETAYSGLWSGTTDRAVDPFSYDGYGYHTTSFISDQYLMWGVYNNGLDASCLDTHYSLDPALDESWKCRDRHHVLLNHISTPFFFREDFTDPNPEHLYLGLAHTVQWGDPGLYSFCDPAGSICLPELDPAEYRERLHAQVEAMIYESAINSELATGADTSMPAGTNFPTFYSWMPSCGKHEGVFDTVEFTETTMTYRTFVHTMNSWLEGFMSLPRTDLRGFRVDQMILDGDSFTTQCQ